MKKLISLLLALVMVFALATVASATSAEDPTYGGKLDKPLVINKDYVVNSGEAPAESFTFHFEPQTYVDPDKVSHNAGDEGVSFPSIGDVTVTYEEAITASTRGKQTLPVVIGSAPLGTYTYKVNEIVPTNKTAGISYHTNIPNNEFYLVLTILRDETNGRHYVAAVHYGTTESAANKVGSIVNEYDSGSLTVKKLIKGNMAIMTDTFNFKVTFYAPNGEVVKSTIYASGGKLTADDAKTINFAEGASSASYEFVLGHDNTITFTNIPDGVTYTVEEVGLVNKKVDSIEGNEYTHDPESDEVYGDATKTIEPDVTDSVVFTNHLDTPVDTGIVLDSMPYVLLLAVAFFGMAMLTKKRRCEN